MRGNRAAWDSLGLSQEEGRNHGGLGWQRDVTGAPQGEEAAAGIGASECVTCAGRPRHAAGHEVEVEVNTDDLNKRLDIFNVAAQRLAGGIVLLGMIIGSAFATSMKGAFLGIELSAVAFAIFIFSISAGLILSIRMMRTIGQKPRRHPRVLYD